MQDQEFYETHLRPLVDYELKKADLKCTKECVHLRVIRNTAQILEVEPEFLLNNTTSIIYIPLSIKEMIQNEWIRCANTSSMNTDEINVYQRFKSTDVHKKSDILKIILTLNKKNITKRDEHSQEKLISSKALPQILAMDGLKDMKPKNYINNLSVDTKNCGSTKNQLNSHVIAVRKLYDYFPTTITGTDAIYLIKLFLLRTYLPYCKSEQVLELNDEIKGVQNILAKSAMTNSDLNRLYESESYMDDMLAKYEETVSLQTIAENNLIGLRKTFKKEPKLLKISKKKGKGGGREDEDEEEGCVASSSNNNGNRRRKRNDSDDSESGCENGSTSNKNNNNNGGGGSKTRVMNKRPKPSFQSDDDYEPTSN